MKVTILLSTYNGEKYISQQLDSILNQSYQDFILYIRDDGSRDNTVSIIEEYQKLNPSKITLLQDGLGNLGVTKSFEALMNSVTSDFYLFADQDDVWMEDKIEKLVKIARVNSIENEPYLLFSNMTVFYEDSNPEYDFFKKFRITQSKIQGGLFQGTISGCLMLFNDKAKQLSLSLNSESNMMHDFNMLMTCYLLGQVELTQEPLIKHRIHYENVVGEDLKKSTLISIKDLMKYAFKSNEYRVLSNSMIRSVADDFQDKIFSYNASTLSSFYQDELKKMKDTKETIFGGGLVKKIGKLFLNHFNLYKY